MPKQPTDVSRFDDVGRLPIVASVGGHRAELLYGGVLGEKWWRNYLHVHSFYEVCHVYSGAGTFRINGKSYTLSRGDTFIARPGEAHEIVSSRKQPLGIYFWAYTLIDTGEQSRSASDAAIAELLLQQTSPTDLVVRIPTLEPLLKLMMGEVTRRSPGYLQMINSLFAKVVLDTARAITPAPMMVELPEPRGLSAAVRAVQTAERYLRDNLDRSFELRDVAAQVNLSERQLTRLFRQVAGTSVLAYLTDLRIKKASQLLLNTELPIKQVATAVGYPDTHYFTTLFGRRMGITPAAFRQSGGTKFLKRSARASKP